MEWIKISSNKLKIMLTAADARRYALSPESADLQESVTRRAFKEILTDVKQETGFDADDKVYIQMYPSREGGCELFVTKMGIEIVAKKGAPGTAYKAQKSLPPQERSIVFCFSDMKRLICVCRRLTARQYPGESRAWQDDSHRYWLLLQEHGDPKKAREDYAFIAEYGMIENKETAEMLLPEHGKAICERNAVETLGAL